MKVVPLRLQPGADLRQALEAWMGEQQEQAACLISAVGSLSEAQLRFAGADDVTTIQGGHLCSGSLVCTTAELEGALLPDCRGNRKLDPHPRAMPSLCLNGVFGQLAGKRL